MPDTTLSHADMADVELLRTRASGFKRVPTNKAQLFLWNGFLDADLCSRIIALANPFLRPSTITSPMPGDPYFRTSSTCDLYQQTSPLVAMLDQKISAALGMPIEYGEPIQAQAYSVGQEFKAHTDFFDPNLPEFAEHAAARGQRTWTFMIYLNDVPEGGHTDFVNLGKKVKPRTGRAVIWNNLNRDGAVNHDTMHYGMPVTEGQKFIITKWYRDRPQMVVTSG